MSSIGYGPLERIDGPPPLRPVYGLLQAAEAPAGGVRIVPDADARGVERWINGVEVYPYPPQTGDVQDACAPGTVQHVKDDGDIDWQHPQFGAMTAYLPVTCTTYKVPSQEEFKARAIASFEAVESGIVAFEFMTGTQMPAQPHLSDGAGTFPLGDTVVGITRAIAALEEEIALTRRQGVIHVSPQLVASYLQFWSLDNRTGVIRTINGTVIIPDAGYAAGSTPTGHAGPSGTQEWLYATGPIDVRRSETFVMPEKVSEAVDRGTGMNGASNGKANSLTYRVERYYVVDWDTTLQAAVLADRCISGCA